MRVKPVPEPPDSLDAVDTAWQAVPLVPASTNDCCYRVMGALELESRAQARTWVTFLYGLGFVTQTPQGFVRVRDPPDALRDAFLNGIYGAREIVDILERTKGVVGVDAVFDDFEAHVPAWEVHRTTVWRRTWKTRVAVILDWLALLGVIKHSPNGYTIDQ